MTSFTEVHIANHPSTSRFRRKTLITIHEIGRLLTHSFRSSASNRQTEGTVFAAECLSSVHQQNRRLCLSCFIFKITFRSQSEVHSNLHLYSLLHVVCVHCYPVYIPRSRSSKWGQQLLFFIPNISKLQTLQNRIVCRCIEWYSVSLY